MSLITKSLLSLLSLFVIGGCHAQTIADPVQTAQTSAKKSKPQMDFRTTSCLPKPDDCILRVKGSLTGAPHTSNRINSARLLVGTASFEAVDIDGVDFERYFQWEDDGVIPLEIDFSIPAGVAMPEIGTDAAVIFSTVYGEYIFDCE